MLLTRTTLQPSVAALVALALADGDFINDLVPHADLMCLAADHADRGADIWEDDQDELPGTVDQALILAARGVLINLGNNLLQAAAADAADARTDAIEAGDVTVAGDPIPYTTYRSA